MMQQRADKDRISVISSEEQRSIQLDAFNRDKTVGEWRQLIIDTLGFSSRIHLYKKPVCPFNKLSFIQSQIPLRQLLFEFPNVCFTYNNTQCIEQPQFIDHFPANKQKIILILQICQGTTFSHQRYQIEANSNISFVKSLAQRYGRNVYFQYYELRIHIDKFGKNQSLADIVKNICYGENTVLVTVDSTEERFLFQCVYNEDVIHRQKYVMLKMKDQEYTMILDRQADWKAVSFLLRLIFECDLQAGQSQHKMKDIQSFRPSNKLDKILISKKKLDKYTFANILHNSVFVGSSNGMILILQQSNFLHIFEDQPPFDLMNSVALNGRPSNYLEEDLPVLYEDYLIMYNITRTVIALKYYDLPRGNLVFIKHFTWPQQMYGEIQCSSLDLLGVSIKNENRARIFYVYDPNNYLQIEAFRSNWKMWVSKRGCNNFSDNTGVVCVFHSYLSLIQVYNVKIKQKLNQINIQFREVQYIRISPSLKTILVKSQSKIIQINTSSSKILNVLPNKYDKAYYDSQNQIFWLTQKVFLYKNLCEQRRIQDMIVLYKGWFFAKDEELIMHTVKGVYVIEKDKSIQSYFQENDFQQS